MFYSILRSAIFYIKQITIYSLKKILVDIEFTLQSKTCFIYKYIQYLIRGGAFISNFTVYIYIYIYQWRRKMPKSGGAHRHVIYVPSVKNQYKRAVFGYMVIYEQRSVSVY